jgi:hypothetical protein
MISDKLIIELQKILKRNYGLDLSFEETAKIGNDWVEAFDVLAQIDFREKYDKD